MSVKLKIMTFNVWGLPLLSSNLDLRMDAIADVLEDSDYNIICFQELWTNTKYELLKHRLERKLPHSHYFRCGVVGSGLCVFSQYPIQDVYFQQWPINGYIHKIQHGDWFGGKGICLVKLKVQNFTINVYNTHVHAEYDTVKNEYLFHRMIQLYSCAQFIKLTSATADLVVLAGDLNTESNEIGYKLLTSMTGLADSYTIAGDQVPLPGTHDSYRNSHVNSEIIQSRDTGKRIDYIFYKSNVATKQNKYEYPLSERVPTENFSYSDHEALCLTLELSEGKSEQVNTPVCRTTLVNCLELCEEKFENLDKEYDLYIYISLAVILYLMTSTCYPVCGGRIMILTRLLGICILCYCLPMRCVFYYMEKNALQMTIYGMKVCIGNLENT